MANEQPDMSIFEDDVSNLDVIAIQFNELFQSLQRAGFSHKEAIELVGIVISNSLVSEPINDKESFSEQEEEEEYLEDYDEDDGEDYV